MIWNPFLLMENGLELDTKTCFSNSIPLTPLIKKKREKKKKGERPLLIYARKISELSNCF